MRPTGPTTVRVRESCQRYPGATAESLMPMAPRALPFCRSLLLPNPKGVQQRVERNADHWRFPFH